MFGNKAKSHKKECCFIAYQHLVPVLELDWPSGIPKVFISICNCLLTFSASYIITSELGAK